MNEQERILFEELHRQRVQASLVFQQEDFSGIWTSIVDKYPESAHFIYELLQNADDAEATTVSIVLKREGLIFKHNGSIHFDITDPRIKGGRKGHINSITGVANSTKKEEGNKIGKFGVGFKAVFQYTESPEIYDDNFRFRIENYIVPVELDHDHTFRAKGETLFYFPFKDNAVSYADVKDRLTSLDNPILFLRHLQNVKWKEEGIDTVHQFSKSEEKDFSTLAPGNILCKYIKVSNAGRIDKLLMFEKPVLLGYTEYPICVGYYLDASGKLNLKVPSRVFCYFPTKETFTDCHFICHAPFLLTDSRQNFKNHKDNDFLKENLAWLAAQSLPVLRDIGLKEHNLLIDENLFDLVSLEEKRYIDWTYQDDLFYPKQVSILKKEPMMLCKDGKYRLFGNCYACMPMSLYHLIGPEQLDIISQSRDKAALVTEKIQQIVINSALKKVSDYCTGLGLNKLTVESLANNINSSFMKSQTDAWVLRLYRFLYEEVKYSWQRGPFRTAPFIKTTKNEWVAPYLPDGTLNVFLPLDVETEDYNIVNKEHLKVDNVKKFFLDLGLKEPSREDYIVTKVLSKYKEAAVILSKETIKRDFDIILSYFHSLPEDHKYSFSVILKDNSYKLYDGKELCNPDTLYFSFDNDLKEFFKYESNPHFLDNTVYKDSVERFDSGVSITLFCYLGINLYPEIREGRIDATWDNYELWSGIRNRVKRHGKETGYSCERIIDWHMDGLESYMTHENVIPANISKLIWGVLCRNNVSQYSLLKYGYSKIRGKYIYYSEDESSIIAILKGKEWLLGRKPNEVSIEELEAEGFDANEQLFEIFGIHHKNNELKKAGLSDEEIEVYNLVKGLTEKGVPIDEIKQLLLAQKHKDEDQSIAPEPTIEEKPTKEEKKQKKDNKEDKKSRKDETRDIIDEHENYADTWKREFGDLKNQPNRKPKPAGSSSFGLGINTGEEEHSGDSVFGQSSGDASPKEKQGSGKSKNADVDKNITEAQNDIIKALNEQDLRQKLDWTHQYTFEWFCLLLGLQKLKLPKENRAKDLCINFYEYELSDDGGMLTLKNPTAQIPHWVEDSSSINLGVLTPNETIVDAKIVSVEAEEGLMYFDVREQDNIEDILSKAKKFVVVCQSQSNIFDSLMKRFAQLEYDFEDNLKEQIPEHISFIYGPPGTGKTTEVVRQIADKVKRAEKYGTKMNILVLTPTNKAADVIADKMLLDEDNANLPNDIREASQTCSPYLRRYGISNSDACKEDYDCVYNRDTMDMDSSDKNIVVTTIARFAYDYILSNGEPVDICDFKWNYIVFDEASMIDLIPLMYVLHKAKDNDTFFIIAGDPKQIPAVNATGYDYGNIYTCVGINNLQYAMTAFKQFPLKALTTQYRSVPDIGTLVSRFSSDGLVVAQRQSSDCKPIKVDKFGFKHVNFFGFDIKDFNLLYSRNVVGQSSINIYSVLFTYELIKYITDQLKNHYPQMNHSIGVVSPYRAEADAIRQLLENYPVAKPVSCGTVHSFQGDQCDIMFVVMNPALSNSSETHVNKEYILNVAMSRAKDYLFIIAPTGKDALPILKRVKSEVLDKYSIPYIEEQCATAEAKLFGQSNWIECNTTITGHGSINTYSDIQSIYDIRLSDTAMDIRKS